MVVMAVSLLDRADGCAGRAGGHHCEESVATGSCQVTVARLVLAWTAAAAPSRQLTAKAPSQ
jgi:acetoin utilization deacetylase AcuC-like enzyme